MVIPWNELVYLETGNRNSPHIRSGAENLATERLEIPTGMGVGLKWKKMQVFVGPFARIALTVTKNFIRLELHSPYIPPLPSSMQHILKGHAGIISYRWRKEPVVVAHVSSMAGQAK